tara:strand:+ start:444 stop:767 length:324 start_codon:yes stop_codon:yes gene_type:complete
MDIEIRLYLKRLKDFFDTDIEARRDMFGHSEIDMEEFYKMVAEKATTNNQKKGEPMLSGTEMLEIVTDLALRDIREEIELENLIKKQQEIKKVFLHIKDGFPPFCLN